jgi:ABC-type sugar transport system substrate-binding protein
MRTNPSGRPRLRRIRPSMLIVTAGLLVSAGCSSTTAADDKSASANISSSDMITADSVDPGQLEATVKRALLDSVPVDKLDPVVANAIAVASKPLTGDQQALLEKCLSAPTCETGRGTLTVGISLYPVGNAARAIWRAETTAQALAYPEVKKIVYVGSGTNIAEVQANLRSLIAQKVDIIVDDPVFGAAILPVAKQATDAGITFVTGNSPLPKEAESVIDAQVPFDACEAAKGAAEKVLADAGDAALRTYGMYTGVPGNAPAAGWQPCLQKAMDDAGWTKAAEGFTQWTAQGEAQEANALISSGSQLGAFFYDYTNDEFLKPYIAAGKTPPANFGNTPNYSFFQVHQQAKDAGLNPRSYVSNGHAWFGRMALTAAMMIKAGQDVPPVVKVPVPVVSMDDIQDQNPAGMPANAPVPTLLTPEQAQFAIAAS